MARKRSQTTILVVEDDRTTAEMLRLMLQSLGHVVFEAANGRDALRLYRHHRTEIDLILTDLMMPMMRGDELIAAVRAFDPDVGIIVLSSSAQQRWLPRLAGQVSSWLQKPPDTSLLAHEIQRVLGRTR